MVSVNERAPTDDCRVLEPEPQANAAATNANPIERMGAPDHGTLRIELIVA
jgi:hypothetical protein